MELKPALTLFLSERKTLSELRKESGLTRSQLEVLACFCGNRDILTFQAIQSILPSMNVQQMREALRALQAARCLSIWERSRSKGVTRYQLTYQGRDKLERFVNVWLSRWAQSKNQF